MDIVFSNVSLNRIEEFVLLTVASGQQDNFVESGKVFDGAQIVFQWFIHRHKPLKFKYLGRVAQCVKVL